jgi:hypothetical protein
MALSPQGRAAEEGRRFLGQLVAAADNMGMRGLVRVDVTAHTGVITAVVKRGLTTSAAVTFVTDQAQAAEDDGKIISFEMLPVFLPVFATQTGLIY